MEYFTISLSIVIFLYLCLTALTKGIKFVLPTFLMICFWGLHIWTVYIIYEIAGGFAAIFSFGFPVAASAFLFFQLGFTEGFNHIFCLVIISIIAAIIAAGLIYVIYEKLTNSID